MPRGPSGAGFPAAASWGDVVRPQRSVDRWRMLLRRVRLGEVIALRHCSV